MLKLVAFLLVLEASRSGALPKHHSKRNTSIKPLTPRSDLVVPRVFDSGLVPKLYQTSDENFYGVDEEERVNNISAPSTPAATPSAHDEKEESGNVSSTVPPILSNTTEEATSNYQENSTSSVLMSSTANTTADNKEVIIPTTKPTTPYFDSIIEQAISRLNDTYTLSILLPVTAGFVLASVVIVMVAICTCIRKRCCRRRFRKKVLPESLRNMRQSDREKLLAETSDEEF